MIEPEREDDLLGKEDGVSAVVLLDVRETNEDGVTESVTEDERLGFEDVEKHAEFEDDNEAVIDFVSSNEAKGLALTLTDLLDVREDISDDVMVSEAVNERLIKEEPELDTDADEWTEFDAIDD